MRSDLPPTQDGGAGPHATAALAQRLGSRIATAEDADHAVLLATPDGLALRCPGPAGPVMVVADLLAAARQRTAGGRPTTVPGVARALGLGAGVRTVVDATAGLGRDAAVLLALGAEVVLIERDPALHALLDDALRRAAETAPEFAARARLLHGDARQLLAGDLPRHDAVLLDPMFPERGKRALPKQDLQVFRAHLGAGDPAETAVLLATARRHALRRVVVKRPPKVAPIAPGAVACIEGPRIRFDVYAPADGARNAKPT